MKKHDGKTKRKVISAHLGWEDYKVELWDMYHSKYMSGIEIAEYINQNMPRHLTLTITPRSIQRTIKLIGKDLGIEKPMRTGKEAFQLAIKRGRVTWKYKSHKIKRVKLNKKLRYSILERDKYRCVKCGADPSVALLEVDHIVAICNGGLSIESNLQTLCYACNQGKRDYSIEK